MKPTCRLHRACRPLPVSCCSQAARNNESHSRGDQNAELLLNKPKGGFRWDPLIESPGVPANMRRLGDLRLECQVLIAVGKEELAFWQRALANTLFLGSDWCNSDKVDLPTFSQRTIKAAWLVDGAARIALPLYELGSGFIAPIRHKAYPDDTLIAIDDGDEDTAIPAPWPARPRWWGQVLQQFSAWLYAHNHQLLQATPESHFFCGVALGPPPLTLIRTDSESVHCIAASH